MDETAAVVTLLLLCAIASGSSLHPLDFPSAVQPASVTTAPPATPGDTDQRPEVLLQLPHGILEHRVGSTLHAAAVHRRSLQQRRNHPPSSPTAPYLPPAPLLPPYPPFEPSSPPPPPPSPANPAFPSWPDLPPAPLSPHSPGTYLPEGGTSTPADSPFWAPALTRCTPPYPSTNTAQTQPPTCPTGKYCESQLASPYYAMCRPCTHVCLACTSPAYVSGGGISGKVSAADCQDCNCTGTSTDCSSSATDCTHGSFCSATAAATAIPATSSAAVCTSCYSCINDSDSVEGSCLVACGISPRASWPSHGLPFYDPTDPTSTDWVVQALLEANEAIAAAVSAIQLSRRSLHSLQLRQARRLQQSSQPATASGAAFTALLAAAGIDNLPPAQVAHALATLDRTLDGSVSAEELVYGTVIVQAGYSLFCPADELAFASGTAWPGCACLAVPEPQLQPPYISTDELAWLTELRSRSSDYSLSADCTAGYRCSAHAARGLRGSLPRKRLSSALGLCVPCLIGEFCPAGTIERSPELLNACLTATQSSVVALGDSGASAAKCQNPKPCPAGAYCPRPDERLTCAAGSFCTLGSAEPDTCDLASIVTSQQYVRVQPAASPVVNNLTRNGVPLSGNSCPAGSANPYGTCPGGSYCGSPSDTPTLCPTGHYCPEGATAPQVCSALLDCSALGLVKPKITWWGILAFIAIIACLPVLLAGYKAVALAERGGRQTSEERLQDFLHELYWLDFLQLLGHAARGPGSSQYHGKGAKSREQGVDDDDDGLQPEPSKISALAFNPEDYTSQKQRKALKILSQGYGHISPNLSLQFNNLGLRLSSGKAVLQDVSGTFPHSHLHAIMGPSGSGKSTLLSLFSGKPLNAVVTGDVEVQRFEGTLRWGAPMSMNDIRYLVGFVPQDDILHDSLTVAENLSFAAALRLPTTWTDAGGPDAGELRRKTGAADRAGVVLAVAQLLGLGHVQHRVVGSVDSQGISGGQRKRVNIGTELVAKPSILFLDEPTSGLDAAVAQDVLDYLSVIAKVGMNVVAVVHQPRYSIFQMFDMVLLLAEGGKAVYVGPLQWLHQYFDWLGFPLPHEHEYENPADFYLDIISGMVPRIGDEDFVPKELPKVWDCIGTSWLQDRLLVEKDILSRSTSIAATGHRSSGARSRGSGSEYSGFGGGNDGHGGAGSSICTLWGMRSVGGSGLSGVGVAGLFGETGGHSWRESGLVVEAANRTCITLPFNRDPDDESENGNQQHFSSSQQDEPDQDRGSRTKRLGAYASIYAAAGLTSMTLPDGNGDSSTQLAQPSNTMPAVVVQGDGASRLYGSSIYGGLRQLVDEPGAGGGEGFVVAADCDGMEFPHRSSNGATKSVRISGSSDSDITGAEQQQLAAAAAEETAAGVAASPASQAELATGSMGGTKQALALGTAVQLAVLHAPYPPTATAATATQHVQGSLSQPDDFTTILYPPNPVYGDRHSSASDVGGPATDAITAQGVVHTAQPGATVSFRTAAQDCAIPPLVPAAAATAAAVAVAAHAGVGAAAVPDISMAVAAEWAEGKAEGHKLQPGGCSAGPFGSPDLQSFLFLSMQNVPTSCPSPARAATPTSPNRTARRNGTAGAVHTSAGSSAAAAAAAEAPASPSSSPKGVPMSAADSPARTSVSGAARDGSADGRSSGGGGGGRPPLPFGRSCAGASPTQGRPPLPRRSPTIAANGAGTKPPRRASSASGTPEASSPGLDRYSRQKCPIPPVRVRRSADGTAHVLRPRLSDILEQPTPDSPVAALTGQSGPLQQAVHMTAPEASTHEVSQPLHRPPHARPSILRTSNQHASAMTHSSFRAAPQLCDGNEGASHALALGIAERQIDATSTDQYHHDVPAPRHTSAAQQQQESSMAGSIVLPPMDTQLTHPVLSVLQQSHARDRSRSALISAGGDSRTLLSTPPSLSMRRTVHFDQPPLRDVQDADGPPRSPSRSTAVTARGGSSNQVAAHASPAAGSMPSRKLSHSQISPHFQRQLSSLAPALQIQQLAGRTSQVLTAYALATARLDGRNDPIVSPGTNSDETHESADSISRYGSRQASGVVPPIHPPRHSAAGSYWAYPGSQRASNAFPNPTGPNAAQGSGPRPSLLIRPPKPRPSVALVQMALSHVPVADRRPTTLMMMEGAAGMDAGIGGANVSVGLEGQPPWLQEMPTMQMMENANRLRRLTAVAESGGGTTAPWRPKDLQAALDHFDTVCAGRRGLSFEEFVGFWQGLRHALDEAQFGEFIVDSVMDFNVKLQENAHISRAEFAAGVKLKLRLACRGGAATTAVVDTGVPVSRQSQSSLHSLQYDPVADLGYDGTGLLANGRRSCVGPQAGHAQASVGTNSANMQYGSVTGQQNGLGVKGGADSQGVGLGGGLSADELMRRKAALAPEMRLKVLRKVVSYQSSHKRVQRRLDRIRGALQHTLQHLPLTTPRSTLLIAPAPYTDNDSPTHSPRHDYSPAPTTSHPHQTTTHLYLNGDGSTPVNAHNIREHSISYGADSEGAYSGMTGMAGMANGQRAVRTLSSMSAVSDPSNSTATTATTIAGPSGFSSRMLPVWPTSSRHSVSASCNAEAAQDDEFDHIAGTMNTTHTAADAEATATATIGTVVAAAACSSGGSVGTRRGGSQGVSGTALVHALNQALVMNKVMLDTEASDLVDAAAEGLQHGQQQKQQQPQMMPGPQSQLNGHQPDGGELDDVAMPLPGLAGLAGLSGWGGNSGNSAGNSGRLTEYQEAASAGGVGAAVGYGMRKASLALAALPPTFSLVESEFGLGVVGECLNRIRAPLYAPKSASVVAGKAAGKAAQQEGVYADSSEGCAELEQMDFGSDGVGSGGDMRSGTAAGNSSSANGWAEGVLDAVGTWWHDGVAMVLGQEVGGRQMPSLWRQVLLVLQRSLVKCFTAYDTLLLDISLLVTLGLIMGATQGYITQNDVDRLPQNTVIVLLAFALACSVAGLRTFGSELVMFLHREEAGGLAVLPYFLGRVLWDTCVLCTAYSAVYLGFYYAMTVFHTSFATYYVIMLCIAWWGFGVGYMFSVLFSPTNALLAALTFALLFGGIVNGVSPTVVDVKGSNVLVQVLQYLSYTRWGVEAVVIDTVVPTPPERVFQTSGALASLGYCDMQDTYGSGGGGALQHAIFLLQVYADPSQLDVRCKPYFNRALGWIVGLGAFFRLITYLTLQLRCSRGLRQAILKGRLASQEAGNKLAIRSKSWWYQHIRARYRV